MLTSTSGGGSTFTSINEYIYNADSSVGKIWNNSFQQYYKEKTLDSIDPTSAGFLENLFLKHIWDDRIYPTFEDSDVSVATFGDNASEIAKSLNSSLANERKVFLPPGVYNIIEPICLAHDNVLLGGGKTLSQLNAVVGLGDNPLLKVASPNDNACTTSVEQAQAASTIVDGIFLNRSVAGAANFIEWQAGSQSIYRDNFFGMDEGLKPASDDSIDPKPQAVLITGLGGGRWYGLAGEWTRFQSFTENADYRGLKVENTNQNLAFYGLNVERIQSGTNPQVEFSNAENFDIYYLKGESQVKNGSVYENGSGPSNLGIYSSTHFNIFGFAGISLPETEKIYIESSSQFILANIGGKKLTKAEDGNSSGKAPDDADSNDATSDEPTQFSVNYNKKIKFDVSDYFSAFKRRNIDRANVIVNDAIYLKDNQKVWVKAFSDYKGLHGSDALGNDNLTVTAIDDEGAVLFENSPLEWSDKKQAYIPFGSMSIYAGSEPEILIITSSPDAGSGLQNSVSVPVRVK